VDGQRTGPYPESDCPKNEHEQWFERYTHQAFVADSHGFVAVL